MVFMPKPIQSARIPIWVACFWLNKKPLRRAARYDGVIPRVADWAKKLTPDDVRQIVAYTTQHCTNPKPYGVMIGGQTPSDPEKGAEIVQFYVEAGTTCWSEELTGWREPLKKMQERVRQGPPKV